MKSLMLILTIIYSTASLAEGLKKVNYQNETSDSKSEAPEAAALSEQEAKKMMEEIEIIKQKQAEQAKALEELEKEE